MNKPTEVKDSDVHLTHILRSEFDKLHSENLDLATVGEFIEEFAWWKSFWNRRERSSFYFGRDSAFREPLVLGQMLLRHVHLPPSEDSEDYARWDHLHEQIGREKTSDTMLVYCYDSSTTQYLLIGILHPPAHQTIQMKSPQAKELLELYAQVAEAFLLNNNNILI